MVDERIYRVDFSDRFEPFGPSLLLLFVGKHCYRFCVDICPSILLRVGKPCEFLLYPVRQASSGRGDAKYVGSPVKCLVAVGVDSIVSKERKWLCFWEIPLDDLFDGLRG